MMTLLSRAVLLTLLVMLLVSCGGEPKYTPDSATIAAREAAEYQIRQDRGELAWKVVLGFAIVVLVMLVILAGFLGSTRYRVAAADAKKAEAEARRLLLVDLGNGAVLDLARHTIHATNMQVAPQVAPAMRAETFAPQQAQSTSLQKFIIDCVRINEGDWQSDVLPRWERWSEIKEPMTSAEWMRLTDELVKRRLIVKEHGKRTVVSGDGDLRWVYDQLPPSPSDGSQLY